MSIFDEVMGNSYTVFKNPDIFTIDYLPEIIQCRDKQLRSILMNIKPVLLNGKTINTIIIGNTSTGKTTVLKHALREVEEHSDITTCYINCNIQDTARKCYLQIYKVLFGHQSRNNLSTEIIQEEVMNKLEEESIVLAIDDLNYLSKNDANKIINDLFRANEFYHSNMALIVTINNEAFRYYLERNAQSILLGHEIEFNDYTGEEIYAILKYRCKLGFKEGVISDSQIKKISYYSAKYGNIRRGLTIIYMLAQEADSENRPKIEDEDIIKYIIPID